MSTSRSNSRRILDDDSQSDTDSLINYLVEEDNGASNISSDQNVEAHEDESNVVPSQDTTMSVQSSVILNQIEHYDDSCSEYLRKGFLSVNPELRNCGQYWYDLPLDVVPDEFDLFKVSPKHEESMDSVSKSFQLIPKGHHSNYMQPYEGAPFCYVERCNSMNIPPHIARVLYFYHSLLDHMKVSGLTGNVIPIEHMSLKKMKNDKGADAKKIVGVFEEILAGCMNEDEIYVSDGLRSFDTHISQTLQERDINGSDSLRERDPLSIRIAFTGAFFKVDGETRQELFCVAIITPLKAFDMVSYIRDYFSIPPKVAAAREQWCQMDLCYKRIQMFEVNYNCGLTCDPDTYRNDIGGKGGIFSVLCMLNIPLRIAWILRNMKQGEHPEDICIIGMPKLSFTENGTMEHYHKYMHAYINEQVEIHDEFQRSVKVYYSTQEPEQSELVFNTIRSPGGWPLKYCALENGRVQYQRFGLFPFPLMMKFQFQKKFVQQPSMESFMLNLGQEPETVVKKKRDFATFDPDAGIGSIMPDSTVLVSTERALPVRILQKYYGKKARPADDFKDTKLIRWYEAMRSYTQSLLEAKEISPDEAMVQVKRHLDSCMEQHISILKNDSYGSVHFEQCAKMVEGVLDTKLATVSVAANLRHMKETVVPSSIRHDTFGSTSFSMLQSWVDYNKHVCWYATNSEAALEFTLSSLLWHLGAHSQTLQPIFQGTLIVSMRGHLEVLIDKLYYIDWRKPNSSGAGAIQVALNRYLEELGRQFKVMPDENNIVFINPNRNTMAALENECCVITVNNESSEVKSKPSPELKDKPILMLENRGEMSLGTLIQIVFPRDAAQRHFTLTTMDLDKTNDRSVALKQQICSLNICGFCTNQKKGTDEPKSLMCVTHVCDPGAPAYYEISDNIGEINHVQCELNDGRASMPSETEMLLILKQIFFSKIFTSVMVALPHRAGMLPFHVNKTSSAFLDWLYMVIRAHLFCVFNGYMIENIGRVQVL
jgi:hypothetical protein